MWLNKGPSKVALLRWLYYFTTIGTSVNSEDYNGTCWYSKWGGRWYDVC